jgi:hypothetical protein
MFNFEWKRKTSGLQRLNPDLPEEAIEGAVEEICRDFFLKALSLAEANREIDKLRLPSGLVLFAPEPERRCNRLRMNEFLFEWKTSVAVSPVGETGRFSEIPVHKLIIITNRRTGKAAR